MKKLKLWCRNKTAWCVAFWVVGCAPVWAGPMQAGSYLVTKSGPTLSGGPGMSGGEWNMAIGIGEPFAGTSLSGSGRTLFSGYYAGFLGAGGAGGLTYLRSKVGSHLFHQDGVQIGVPLDTNVWMEFSDPLLPESLPAGITVTILMDHLGRLQNTPVHATFAYDASTTTVLLSPISSWQGNTLYEITFTSDLRDIDGFSYKGSDHIRFITALDPAEENVVLNPILPEALQSGAPTGTASIGKLHLDIPSQALTGFSFALVNRDPLNHPIRIHPEIIREANQKSQTASGGHSAPLRIEEIVGFNLQGEILSQLSRPAVLSVSYAGAARPGGLALWGLDETHKLWVKIPGSARDIGGEGVTAPITRFSVYALIAGPVGSAADAFVFPNPWRPFGPNAGNGAEQTGTEQAGMTFSNLPSDCAIRIYTISGALVRELHHSDLSSAMGQETWNGLTKGGSRAASGVYVWRVESATDGKNGKLMIIR